jgi:periplasmic protein TonB
MEIKKTSKANLERKKNIFFQLGLVISLLLVFAAFEWKTYEKTDYSLRDPIFIPIDEDIIDNTHRDKKEPEIPKTKITELIEVPNDEADDTAAVDAESDEHIYKDIVYMKPVDETGTHDEVEPPFIVVEKMPEFPGGINSMNEFLAKNMKYPRLAVETGIQGIVFATFVVEKDGSITGIQILHGIGGGCDEEAIRVIRQMPKWDPGKQRGVPVRVQLNLPVKFVLKTN